LHHNLDINTFFIGEYAQVITHGEA